MRLLHLATLVAWTIRSRASGVELDRSEPQGDNVMKPSVFSPHWADDYFSGEEGCTTTMGIYVWRSAGLGSNINNLLYAWVHALTVKGWQDMAIIDPDQYLGNVTCSEESGVEDLRGWDCIFSPMPHVCTFGNEEELNLYLQRIGVWDVHQTEAHSLELRQVRLAEGKIRRILKARGVDYLGALAVLQKNLWDRLTPWVRSRMDDVVRLSGVGSEVHSPYLALHIRRGDKVRLEHTKRVPVQEYLSKAKDFLNSDTTTVSSNAIRSIWVASDNGYVANEVRRFASEYFPEIRVESIVWISGDTTGKFHVQGVKTRTMDQVFEDFIPLLLDLQYLAGGELFVGTLSSNMGRLVLVMREAQTRPRETTISLDKRWKPHRRELVLKHSGCGR